MTQRLTRKRALELTHEIRNGLDAAQKASQRFINGQGWLSLGYATFDEWYDDNLSDLTLAMELTLDASRG